MSSSEWRVGGRSGRQSGGVEGKQEEWRGGRTGGEAGVEGRQEEW